jgi:hypothetical protein
MPNQQYGAVVMLSISLTSLGCLWRCCLLMVSACKHVYTYTPACCQVVQDKANWGVLGRLANFTYAFATELKVRGQPCISDA